MVPVDDLVGILVVVRCCTMRRLRSGFAVGPGLFVSQLSLEAGVNEELIADG